MYECEGNGQRMTRPSFWGFILFVIGALFLCSKLGVVNFPSTVFSAGVIWSLLLALLGLSGLRHFRRKIPWGSLFLFTLGIGWALQDSGITPILSRISGWDLLWGLMIVFFGLSLIIPGRWGFRASISLDNEKSQAKYSKIYKAKAKERGIKHFIGDLNLGKQPWELRNMDIWHGIGDVRVNLTTAHTEDGEYRVAVGGLIGDVRILVPEDVAVSVDAVLTVGDIDVLGDHHSGTKQRVQFTDVGFATAAKRIYLDVDWKIGDVQIVRV